MELDIQKKVVELRQKLDFQGKRLKDVYKGLDDEEDTDWGSRLRSGQTGYLTQKFGDVQKDEVLPSKTFDERDLKNKDKKGLSGMIIGRM